MFALKRTKFDTRGHSGKEPTALIRKANYGEDRRPAQVHFHSKEGLKVWDSRDEAFKERVPSFEISGKIDIDLPVRFASKVALAAGYYAYGNLFRQNVDHQQFRDVMNTDLRKLDLTKTPADMGLGHLTLRVDSYLREVPYEPANDALNTIRAFCSSVEGFRRGTCPQAMIASVVGVGVLGQYVATVIATAETESFPNDGKLRLGARLGRRWQDPQAVFMGGCAQSVGWR